MMESPAMQPPDRLMVSDYTLPEAAVYPSSSSSRSRAALTPRCMTALNLSSYHRVAAQPGMETYCWIAQRSPKREGRDIMPPEFYHVPKILHQMKVIHPVSYWLMMMLSASSSVR